MSFTSSVETDRPPRLVLDDGQQLAQAKGLLFFGLGGLALVAGIVLRFTKATPKDLVLPLGGLGLFWLVFSGIFVVAGLVHRFFDRRAIRRLFRSECWLRWQYQPDEWRDFVESSYRSLLPEPGLRAFVGAAYSGLVGLLLGAILLGVVTFVIQDEGVKPYLRITAGGVFLLLLGVGLVQPLQERRKARRYRRKALRVQQPRVWFSAFGIYHEAFGHTPLKTLVKVSDLISRRQAIRFTTEETVSMGAEGGGSDTTYRLPTVFPVPSGYEEQASRLVRRYRAERLGG
jgi:hypothetical protein